MNTAIYGKVVFRGDMAMHGYVPPNE